VTIAAPLVSIVMPTFNQDRYLAQAIESVLAQTYANVELIVLDDGSTDETSSILERYEGRLTFQRHANMGQAATLNKGWAMSQGTVLGYLSSDDALEPTAVAASVSALLDEPVAVATYCDFMLMDDAGRPVRAVRTEPFDARRLVEDLICLPGPGALFLRSAYLACGGWNARYRQVPDFDFWLRLHRLGPFVRVPNVLARYRIHEQSASLRLVPAERSDEIIDVVAAYWRAIGPGDADARRASAAMSMLLAARSHFSAGRVGAALSRVFRAWAVDPRRAAQALSWRILVGGFVRRPFYAARRLWLELRGS
jgi:glycosyltransferase involved in cell wall biosynthesis